MLGELLYRGAQPDQFHALVEHLHHQLQQLKLLLRRAVAVGIVQRALLQYGLFDQCGAFEFPALRRRQGLGTDQVDDPRQLGVARQQ